MRRDLLFGALALARLTNAQNDGDQEQRIEECFPDDPSAPCVSIETIEAICMQRGISLADHQRCMCSGSFFEDWLGCRQCLRVNGALAEAEVSYWSSIMEGASSVMCDGATPTTYWQDYFASAIATAEPQTGASSGTAKTTLVSATDVSLYYTAPSNQGPGMTTTVTPLTESQTSTGTGMETETATTTSGESSKTETETQTGDGQGNGGNEDAAGRIYAQGAAILVAIIAGAALVMVM